MRALVAVTCLVLCLDAALAQTMDFEVDGEYEDWGSDGQGPSMLDNWYDVTPDTNLAIDVGWHDYGYGEFQDPNDGTEGKGMFAFIFEFLGASLPRV